MASMAAHPKFHSRAMPSMAAHPKRSFHNHGINGVPSRCVTLKIWPRWQPIPSCHSIIWPSVASHPEFSLHDSGINGSPSRVGIPEFGHHAQPVQSCHSLSLASMARVNNCHSRIWSLGATHHKHTCTTAYQKFPNSPCE
eukprot:3323671-Amphidinium_carterae.1